MVTSEERGDYERLFSNVKRKMNVHSFIIPGQI